MQKPLSLQSNTTHEITQQISRKLFKMDVLTSETCWALNNEIKSKWHQVGLSLFNYFDGIFIPLFFDESILIYTLP